MSRNGKWKDGLIPKKVEVRQKPALVRLVSEISPVMNIPSAEDVLNSACVVHFENWDFVLICVILICFKRLDSSS